MFISGLLLWLYGDLIKNSYKQLFTTNPIVNLEDGQSKKIDNITFIFNENKKSLTAIDEAMNTLGENEGYHFTS